ncbi:MAG: flavohemoprotein [Deltaproteobacteria bacterium]|nr:flavohemoprotein [Deltaproteobacteria bacterium]
MTIDAQALRNTLEIALTQDDFPERFYARLFAAHPECRELFTRNSQGAQHKMFAQKLCAIVDSIEDPSSIAAEARKIAHSHGEYGVRAEMYAWVGVALVETLRETSGDAWSEVAERSWIAAYQGLTNAILSPPGG